MGFISEIAERKRGSSFDANSQLTDHAHSGGRGGHQVVAAARGRKRKRHAPQHTAAEHKSRVPQASRRLRPQVMVPPSNSGPFVAACPASPPLQCPGRSSAAADGPVQPLFPPRCGRSASRGSGGHAINESVTSRRPPAREVVSRRVPATARALRRALYGRQRVAKTISLDRLARSCERQVPLGQNALRAEYHFHHF